MTDKLYIDDIDAFSEYGVFIYENGYNEILSFPKFKKLDSNNWHEEDGIEYDLSSPKLDARDFSIQLSFNDESARYNSLIELLSNGSYHEFYFKEIGRTLILRMTDSSLSIRNSIGVLTLVLSDDFPLEDYSYVAPNGTALETDYVLDDINISEYGISVLEGAYQDVEKTPKVKQNLSINTSNISGLEYDDDTIYYEPKEVKIPCLLRADSLADLWKNRDALLYNLSQPNARDLFIQYKGYSFPCVLKSCESKEFYKDPIWWEFDLTLEFTGFRNEQNTFLIDPFGIYLTDENDNYLIA